MIQLLGAVCAGGFIGEFYRTSSSPVSLRIFIAHFMAGSFLSFLVAYIFYNSSKNKTISLAMGGFLSYQDEKFINRVAKYIFAQIKNFKLPPEDDENKTE